MPALNGKGLWRLLCVYMHKPAICDAEVAQYGKRRSDFSLQWKNAYMSAKHFALLAHSSLRTFVHVSQSRQ